MRIERITVNASPLIALFRSGQAELLPRLFQQIYVPEAVWREVTDERHQDAASRGIVSVDWLLRVNVTGIHESVRLWNLGAGESAVRRTPCKIPPAGPWSTIWKPAVVRKH